jgi:hypothetical protein
MGGRAYAHKCTAPAPAAATRSLFCAQIPTSNNAVGEGCRYIVKLFRSDFLTATMEVDMSGAISKAATCTLYKPGTAAAVGSVCRTSGPLVNPHKACGVERIMRACSSSSNPGRALLVPAQRGSQLAQQHPGMHHWITAVFCAQIHKKPGALAALGAYCNRGVAAPRTVGP